MKLPYIPAGWSCHMVECAELLAEPDERQGSGINGYAGIMMTDERKKRVKITAGGTIGAMVGAKIGAGLGIAGAS